MKDAQAYAAMLGSLGSIVVHATIVAFMSLHANSCHSISL